MHNLRHWESSSSDAHVKLVASFLCFQWHVIEVDEPSDSHKSRGAAGGQMVWRGEFCSCSPAFCEKSSLPMYLPTFVEPIEIRNSWKTRGCARIEWRLSYPFGYRLPSQTCWVFLYWQLQHSFISLKVHAWPTFRRKKLWQVSSR